MATATVDKDFIEAVAEEIAAGVNAAVECWMAEIESILQDPRFTTLGRLQGVSEVIARYRYLTGTTDMDRCDS
jgi:hypothetical protein